MVAPVIGSLVEFRGGFSPGKSPTGKGGALHCCNFLSACINQTGVNWPIASAFRWFSTVSVAYVLPFFVCSCLSYIFTGVGDKSGAPNFYLPSTPVGYGCQSGAL